MLEEDPDVAKTVYYMAMRVRGCVMRTARRLTRVLRQRTGFKHQLRLRRAVLLIVCIGLGVGAVRNVFADQRATNRAVPQATIDPRKIVLPLLDGADIRFRPFNTIEGPAKSNAGPFVQDNRGFVWFGTPYGLNRFDGYTFKVFTHDPKNARSISGSFVNSLFKDHNGRLWVGCNQFLNKLDSATETFTRYPVPDVFHMSEDAVGTLWLSTPTGLYALNPANGNIRRYAHDSRDPTSLKSDDIKSSGEDKKGTFWVATSEGLDSFDRAAGEVTLHIPIYEAGHTLSFYEDRFGEFWIYHVSGNPLAVFDRKTNTLTQFSFRDEHGLALTGITGMLEDQNGTLWLSTNGAGLLKFDREHRRFVRYRHRIGDPDSLAQNSVRTLFQDGEGVMWVSLGGFGIARFTSKPQPFKRYRHDFGNPADQDEPFVGAILQDRQGILWIGTHDGLHRIDRTTNSYRDFHLTGPGEGTDAITICKDRLGYLWVGTYGHGLFRFDPRTGHFKRFQHNPADPHSLSNDIIPRVFVDHNATVWAATYEDLDRFDAVTGGFTTYKVDMHVRTYFLDVAEDRRGVLWLGTASSGLLRFDPATAQFTAYQHEINQPGSLSDNRVNSVHFDRYGTMWVGTQEGLNRFDAGTGQFTVYSQREGLPGNDVGCVLEDSRGDLWMSTDNGVAQFNPQTHNVKSYSTTDGLPGRDLTGWGTCFHSTAGEMFFGGFSGATAFFPDDVIGTEYTPPVALTEFRLFGTEVEPGAKSPLKSTINYTDTVVLSHAQNIFSIGFSALSYLNPTTNRYRYMLEGLDPHWTEVGSDRRFATYTTLPAGKYTFRVQGATSRGPWDEPGTTLGIEILPAWWSTWWFRVVCLAASLGLLGALYQWRVRQLRRQEKHLRDVINAVPASVWSTSPDGAVDFVNERWQELTGVPPEGALGWNWEAVLHADDRAGFIEHWRKAVKSGQAMDHEVRVQRATGEYRWLFVRNVPLRDKKGNIVKWYGTSFDIEDRKRAEEERERLRQLQADLAHVNRVSTLGELTASIAHELKQPIAAAITNAKTSLRWLAREKPDLQEAREAILRAVNDNTRGAEIIDRLRSFYKKGGPPEREWVDVNELACEMMGLLRNEAARYSISMSAELVADLPKTKADRVQLQQVFMNLMLNAIEAMKDTSGELTIKSERNDDGQLLISIRDTGVGLPPEKIDQIFSAFYTTKPQGTGMGLAISRTIIESHGGRLWASANSGPGATFHFSLPCVAVTLSSSAA
jgi:PAS domain S-box-containing protein